MSQRIAIIGGGISGLACAFRLLELKQEKNLDINKPPNASTPP
jgi:glycine/D-amino acid oxidase-like deaminating enzyme